MMDYSIDGNSSQSEFLISNQNENDQKNSLLNRLNSSIIFHFLCPDCATTPIIEFKKKIILLQCNCQNTKNTENPKNTLSFKKLNLLQKYRIFNYEKNERDSFICKDHNDIFKFYCLECEKNLCKDCKCCESHKNKKDFGFQKFFIYKKIENLIDHFKLDKNNDEMDFCDPKCLLKRLISSILYDILENPNFNLLTDLENIYNDIKNIKDELDEKKNEEIKNYSSKDLIGKSEDELKLIKHIRIIESDFYNLSCLDKNLNSLVDLELKQNNICDIEPLIYCKFPNLKFLSLERNKISDISIKYIYKFNFPNLEKLNFNLNYFSDFQFFNSVEHFKNLNNLNIGSNKFDQATFRNKEFNLNSINEIILSNGVFNDDSISILSNFNMENIETIDLSSNNLSYLSFVKGVNWPNLSKLNLSYNNIEEINDLDKFSHLSSLEIFDNKISDIEKVKNLKNKIPKLEVHLRLYHKDIIEKKEIDPNNDSTNINSEN